MAAIYQDILYWGVHLLAIFKTVVAWTYMSFSFSGCLGTVNLGISALVYHSTRAERKQKMMSENELSTRLDGRRATPFPCSFNFLSMLTGLLNWGGAFFRTRHIHLLEIPTTLLTEGAADLGDSTLLAKLIEAEWIVAVNDWGSLFLAIAFFLSGCFNFATVRELRSRSREEQESLLPHAVERSSGTGKIAGFEGVVEDSVFFLHEKMDISVPADGAGVEESRLGGS